MLKSNIKWILANKVSVAFLENTKYKKCFQTNKRSRDSNCQIKESSLLAKNNIGKLVKGKKKIFESKKL